MRMTARLFAAVAVLGASPVLAQSGISGANVTIQLPNFTVFGVNTTVLVPDSGPSPLARHRQTRYSRAMYGRFHPQRAIGAHSSLLRARQTNRIAHVAPKVAD